MTTTTSEKKGRRLDHSIDDLLGWVALRGIHAVAFIAPFYVGTSLRSLLLLMSFYAVYMFAITGGYHRYFAHRAYQTSRVFQFVMALVGSATIQKGPLWWAGTHRKHHKYSDTPLDPHSLRSFGFWYSHIGWLSDARNSRTDFEGMKDLARFPELRALERLHPVPPLLLALLAYSIDGWRGVVWNGVAIVACWNATFSINSFAHLFGTRRFKNTGDESRNNLLLALITFGEGWHNNHHRFPTSARQGLVWWEVDCTYYVLKVLEFLGVVWDLRVYPGDIHQEEEERAEGETV